ncbi:MAG: S9 family peptidase [Candidatus Palauibacterales bacterium]|nr:S9 family peptidase [Candidatus Palauibacterales bacterium]MDP2530645.1 S9 family peptidase [Candidatus Palauibacterales bacterium]MDP2583556.1 S9 family peptidase [Candidatus Palauibacterales bacterium]
MNVVSLSALALVLALPPHATAGPGAAGPASRSVERPTAARVLVDTTASADTAGPHTTFRLTDVRRIVQVGSPEISPDGRRVAVTVSRQDWEKDKSRRELDLVDAATGSMRPLTYRRDGVSSPRWSPSGDRLAFVARDSATKESQVWVLHMDGGDPMRLTDSKTGISSYSWSPDGRSIAYIAQDTVPDPKAVKHHEDAFQVTLNNYQVRKAVQPWHLWMIPADGGTAKRLTSGNWSLQTVPGGAAPPAWSPDGASILVVRHPGVWFGNAYRSTLIRVDTAVADSSGGAVSLAVGVPDTAAVRIGTTGDTLLAGEGAGGPKFAPKGGALAFQRNRGGDMNNGNAVYVLRDGKVRDVTADMARDIGGFAWLPDGKSFLMAGALGGRSVMWEKPADGPARVLDLGDVQPSRGASVSNGGAVAFIGTTAGQPGQLYYLASPSAKPRQLTHFNAFLDSLHLGRVDTVAWTGPGGFHEDGVLTYPPDFHKGTKLPLVLVVHGGPEGASTARFSPLPQLLAARGYLVFEPNYRGSINLGDAYQHAIYRDTGEGPGKDVMAGLAAVERLGVVDTTRIGVSGWSYGGYMTTWLTGHYQVWKAAVAGAALTDWVMDYTIAFYQQGDLYFFGGSPWMEKDWQIWRDQSPIQSARNVTAPTLVMGDIGDPNVPVVNSFEWYHAIRDNGVETEFWAYPADSHFPGDIVRTTDVYRRWIDWMDRHLKPGN